VAPSWRLATVSNGRHLLRGDHIRRVYRFRSPRARRSDQRRFHWLRHAEKHHHALAAAAG
jgi:hypothetical protein